MTYYYCRSARQTSLTHQLDGLAGQTSGTDQLDGPAGRTSWTDQRNGPAERTSWTDQFSLSLGQFAYLKIDLSVGTLLQLPSPTKALFIGNKVKTGQAYSGFAPKWQAGGPADFISNARGSSSLACCLVTTTNFFHQEGWVGSRPLWKIHSNSF